MECWHSSGCGCKKFAVVALRNDCINAEIEVVEDLFGGGKVLGHTFLERTTHANHP